MKQAMRADLPPAFRPDGRDLSEQCRRWEVNEADRCALEAALQARERGWASAVTCITAGPVVAEEALRYGLAAGADRALRVDTVHTTLFEPAITGTLLGTALRQLGARLVFTVQGSDAGHGAVVPAYLAHALGAAYLSEVWDLSLSGPAIEVQRRLERGHRQIWSAPLPAVLAFAPGAREPRYVSVAALALARHGHVENLTVQDSGGGAAQISGTAKLERLAPARVRVKKTLAPRTAQTPAERMRVLTTGATSARQTRLVQGTLEETVSAVREFLCDHQILEQAQAGSTYGAAETESARKK